MASKLRKYRLMNEITLQELAEKVGCCHTLISEIERGLRYAYPSLQRRIAEATGIPVEKLFTDDGFAR